MVNYSSLFPRLFLVKSFRCRDKKSLAANQGHCQVRQGWFHWQSSKCSEDRWIKEVELLGLTFETNCTYLVALEGFDSKGWVSVVTSRGLDPL